MDIIQIKELREITGISISECRKALEEARGNIEKAKEILRKWGKKFAESKIKREVGQGIVISYVHGNQRVGVLLDLRCETDFVAKSPDFQKLAHELCLQIAAMSPLFLKPEDVPQDYLTGEKKIFLEQFKDSGKPQKIIDEIVAGKLERYKQEISLVSQAWIKDETKTSKDLIDEYIAKLGENIRVEKFVRYEI